MEQHIYQPPPARHRLESGGERMKAACRCWPTWHDVTWQRRAHETIGALSHRPIVLTDTIDYRTIRFLHNRPNPSYNMHPIFVLSVLLEWMCLYFSQFKNLTQHLRFDFGELGVSCGKFGQLTLWTVFPWSINDCTLRSLAHSSGMLLWGVVSSVVDTGIIGY